MPAPANRDRLEEFLLSAFRPDELRRLVLRRFGYTVLASIAPRDTPAAFAAEVAAALDRLGLIGDPLFDALASARPQRAKEIQRLRQALTKRHVFISFASADRVVAKGIVDALQREGVSVWLTEDLVPGDDWRKAIEEAVAQASVIVVLLTNAFVNSEWARAEVSMASSRGGHILPVVVGDAPDDVPALLRTRQYLQLGDPPAFHLVVDAVMRLTDGTAAADPGRPSPIVDLALRFLEAVGRDVRVLEPSLLRIPEAVVLAGTAPPTDLDVAALEGRLTEGEVAYFLHDDAMPEPVAQRLDGVRIRGNPVVVVAADTMRAALQDGNAPAVFAEHTRLGTGGVNLFEGTNAIVNPDLFFGRTELLNRVGGAIRNGDAVLVTGVRKAGKSSFLHMLRQAFSARPVAWIDLQGFDRADPKWPERAFTAVLTAWDRWGRATWSDAWPFAHGTKPTDQATFLEEVEARWERQRARGSDQGILVILDEVERVLPADDAAVEADHFERFAGALRSLAQTADRKVKLLVADLRPEANRRNLLPNRHTNPWFGFFLEVPLPPLARSEVMRMVRRLAARMGVAEVDDRFVEELHAFTGGHAFLTRTLAAASWTRRASPQRLGAADLGAGRRHLEQQGTLRRFYEENLWTPLTDVERQTLSAVPQRGFWHGVWRRLVARSSSDAEALTALRAQGLLDDGGVAIGGFEDWLRHRPPAPVTSSTSGPSSRPATV